MSESVRYIALRDRVPFEHRLLRAPTSRSGTFEHRRSELGPRRSTSMSLRSEQEVAQRILRSVVRERLLEVDAVSIPSAEVPATTSTTTEQLTGPGPTSDVREQVGETCSPCRRGSPRSASGAGLHETLELLVVPACRSRAGSTKKDDRKPKPRGRHHPASTVTCERDATSAVDRAQAFCRSLHDPAEAVDVAHVPEPAHHFTAVLVVPTAVLPSIASNFRRPRYSSTIPMWSGTPPSQL